MNSVGPNSRFRQARERLGLSLHELATQCGVSESAIYDIEEFDGDLTCCYSPADLRRFCQALHIHPSELFGERISEPAISPEDLVRCIHDECRARGITVEQFEAAVGWRLSACIEPPEKLPSDITIDGLQWLCRELRIDWRRAL